LLHFGVTYGRRPRLHLTMFAAAGRLCPHWTVPLPRPVFLHDWLVTERHVLFILHPGLIPLRGVAAMLLGWRSPADVLRWEPALGNLVLVLDRAGPSPPLLLEAEAAWMWHALNAYDAHGEIIADFLGAPEIVGLGHPEAPFFAVMRGHAPAPPAPEARARVRRYVINPATRTLREDVLAADDGYEMPVVNPHLSCHRHRYGYCARHGQAGWLWSSVARVDTQTGLVTGYDFGPGHYCSEPVFVPQPGVVYEAGAAAEPGWLLTVVSHAATRRSSLAVLAAEQVGSRPRRMGALNAPCSAELPRVLVR
jgi:all-trans-8'-apo-beta-carotenal 15,15'-oxygenase